MGFVIDMIGVHFERAIPQRARRKILVVGAANLPIEPAVGFEQPLIAQRAVEEHLAIGANLGRGDHPVEEITELSVKIAGDERVEGLIERDPTTQQQHCAPRRRNQHHPARERAGVRRSASRRCGV